MKEMVMGLSEELAERDKIIEGMFEELKGLMRERFRHTVRELREVRDLLDSDWEGKTEEDDEVTETELSEGEVERLGNEAKRHGEETMETEGTDETEEMEDEEEERVVKVDKGKGREQPIMAKFEGGQREEMEDTETEMETEEEV